jgi:hypothetical protein
VIIERENLKRESKVRIKSEKKSKNLY